MKTASLVVFCLLLAVCGISHAALPTYEVTDLGALYGLDSYGMAINNQGLAVGYSSTQDGDFHAFLCTPGAGMKDIGTLGGWSSLAYGVNDAGQVVGYSSTEGNGDRAFIYTEQSGMLDLGVPAGPGTSSARAINNSGQVAGQMMTEADLYPHAFLYTPGSGPLDLGALGGYESYGVGINSLGQVVGLAATESGELRAFLHTPGSGMSDLGLLPGGIYSMATDVNDSGVVVGYCWTNQWQNRAFAHVPGYGLMDLGTLGGNGAQAYGVNNSGNIVGDVDMQGVARAFVYAPDGSMALLSGVNGGQSHARGINDSGQVVGFADSSTGMPHAVVWTPVKPPEPPPAPKFEVRMMILPRTLNLRSRGMYVSCVIDVSGAKTVKEIVLKSLRLQGTVPTTCGCAIYDLDRDRVPEMVVLFSRCLLDKTLKPGNATITLTGSFKDGTSFEAKDTIRVLGK